MINKEDALYIGNKLNVDFNKIKLEDFLIGLNIELEHGLINPNTNVTNDDLEMTAKIAIAHLNEYNDYYNNDYGLPALERLLNTKKSQK